MTVKELKAVLDTVKNDNLPVVMNSYYVNDVNGYFYSKQDGKEVLMLTSNYVQPRVEH